MTSSLSVFFRNHRGRLLICLLLALAGWLLSLKIPPMQSPDENQHVARAYLLAHGDLTLSTLPSRNSGGWVDGGLVSSVSYTHLNALHHSGAGQDVRGESCSH